MRPDSIIIGLMQTGESSDHEDYDSIYGRKDLTEAT